jgi:hypothetical protein
VAEEEVNTSLWKISTCTGSEARRDTR